jgi:hypothetical protein
MQRGSGTVWICPVQPVPSGDMVDPATGVFWASWQPDGEAGHLSDCEDVHIVGADAAIAWGLERSPRVLIRLGHSKGTYFSASTVEDHDHPLAHNSPRWPPASAPSHGWWNSQAHDAQ